MCGIVGIVNLEKSSENISGELIRACEVIRHRGPDDEGFLTWNAEPQPKIWFGEDTANSTKQFWGFETLKPGYNFSVGLGHRRLSILDLSPAGHQPMVFKEKDLAISFNGEVYNYLEIKADLERFGHKFSNATDTEVILHAWAEWGEKCLDRFNGMFAFIILDYKNNLLYAVRDRFGVKPLYQAVIDNKMIFASEIKQIRSLKAFKPQIDDEIIGTYLAYGAIDHNVKTTDPQIKYVAPGHYVKVDLVTKKAETIQWYALKPQKWKGNYEDAAEHLKSLLKDAVKLRLRSDVAVGSCLSGGLDSSSIVCLASELLKESGDFVGQETVTACYDEAKYDEWNFAKQVIDKTNARSHQTFPGFDQLESEIDSFLWHQDEPTGSTSQFSQWAVFKKTHEAGLKVMIDGQGADEQLAGYGGNDLAFYSGLLRKARYAKLLQEIRVYKKQNGNLPYAFIIGALQVVLGKAFTNVLPKNLQFKNQHSFSWLKNEPLYFQQNGPAKSLQENLLRQVHGEPLPALLRYEDRNSMAWSVESRTPFMDYRLLEFNLGLPETFLYENGIRKKVLRSAMNDVLPKSISARKDKMGFVTPEEVWLKNEGKKWFEKNVMLSVETFPHYFNRDNVKKYFNNVVNGDIPFDFTIWRMLSIGKWYKAIS